MRTNFLTSFRGICLKICLSVTEWYKGRIVLASSDRNTWTVQFDDGDIASNICSQCVRPFISYEVGERVEVRISDFDFAAGQIAFVNLLDGTYDVSLESEEVISGASSAEIRRVDSDDEEEAEGVIIMKPGDRVMAMFPDVPHKWFPGVIERKHKDGSFAIEYDDGDYAPRVMSRHVRLM